MVAESDPPRETPIDPAILELIQADAAGEFPADHVPLPPDRMRARREWKEFFARKSAAEALPSAPSSAGRGPHGRIGPETPDHPKTDHDPGGRDPSSTPPPHGPAR